MSSRLTKIDVDELKEGMILGENLYDSLGNILLGDGITLRETYIVKIKTLDISNVWIKNKLPIKEMKKENHSDPYLLETRLEAKRFIADTMQEFYLNGAVVEKVLEIVNKLIEELLENDEIVISLGKLRTIDDYTLEHSVNVCIMSLVIGLSYGFEYEELVDLGVGAILHDIGKMLIPQEILNKPGALTVEEYEIVKNHTTYGYDILKKSEGISGIAAEIALSHHERPDGNGYPLGRKAEQIRIYSKIVAICDVYDALTSDRVYKKGIVPHKALQYICKMVDTQFDNELVKKLLNCVKIYPVGSLVRLNTNELGLVVDISKINPSKPIVRILLDEKGNKVTNYLEVDTNKNLGIQITNVFPKFEGRLS
ncbi:HD-GYP domain-containing protein [Wukongibacter baidiensis]|uniref:HD-GYP domain-containing protein n=1 Tax=Wukongibacter baidiensis TaxID=1723361 RepID=UPI003D7F957B